MSTHLISCPAAHVRAAPSVSLRPMTTVVLGVPGGERLARVTVRMARATVQAYLEAWSERKHGAGYAPMLAVPDLFNPTILHVRAAGLPALRDEEARAVRHLALTARKHAQAQGSTFAGRSPLALGMRGVYAAISPRFSSEARAVQLARRAWYCDLAHLGKREGHKWRAPAQGSTGKALAGLGRKARMPSPDRPSRKSGPVYAEREACEAAGLSVRVDRMAQSPIALREVVRSAGRVLYLRGWAR